MFNSKTISKCSNDCNSREADIHKKTEKSLVFFCSLITWVILSLCAQLANISVAKAASIQIFSLDGMNWHVPAEYVSAPAAHTDGAHSFSLRYELPNFTAVNLADFKGVYPEDDRPILTVEVSYDQNSPDPSILLNKYIAEAEKDCPTCTNTPSSVGGMEYATFNGIDGFAPYSPDGVLFRLYEYPNTNGQYSVCYFGPDLAPLQCNITRKIDANLVLTIDFPIEYVTQGPDLMSHAVMLLDRYQPESKQSAVNAHSQINTKPTCWHPAAGTEDAETIPLKIGPETWQIPRAYASTFGLDQTSDPKYDSISFWLKLPDLEPLSATDPSPIVIRGWGNYISIMMGYDSRKWNDSSKSSSISVLIKASNYVGKNAFTDYVEYQSFSGHSTSALRYLYKGDLDFTLNSNTLDLSSFPPGWFTCSQYGGSPSPACIFRLNEVLRTDHKTNENFGHYDIQYGFSRDYFSQLYEINACMQKLYKMFRYDGSD